MWIRQIARLTMLSARSVCNDLPLVVVLGATGTGKSKLAIEIAQKFNGEIISADSMQVYKGLDIITNKVTAEEQCLIKHHLLDFVDPLDDFHVHEFRNRALSVIEHIHQIGKLPVLVGGTHYYIESVLWNVLIDHEGDTSSNIVKTTNTTSCADESLCTISTANDNLITNDSLHCPNAAGSDNSSVLPLVSNLTERDSSQLNDRNDAVKSSCSEDISNSVGDTSFSNEIVGSNLAMDGSNSKAVLYHRHMADQTDALYKQLCIVDPERAACLHPLDRRKIIRSLQVWQDTGLPHSQHLRRQRESTGGSVLGGGLRYPCTAVLWVHCDAEVLRTRVEARVDDMLQRGLLRELLDFHEKYNKQRLMDEDAAHLCNSRPATSSVFSREESTNVAGDASKDHVEVEHKKPWSPDDLQQHYTRTGELPALMQTTSEAEMQGLASTIAAGKTSTVLVTATGTCPGQCNASVGVEEAGGDEGQQPSRVDYTQGIFQSIGFKEFHEYLILPEEERCGERGDALHRQGVDMLKLVTCRYARKQLKWIKNRFTRDLERQVPPMYLLDATDPEQWPDRVLAPAVSVVQFLLQHNAPPPAQVVTPVQLEPTNAAHTHGRFERHECLQCKRVFVGRHQWEQHLASNNHKRNKSSEGNESKIYRRNRKKRKIERNERDIKKEEAQISLMQQDGEKSATQKQDINDPSMQKICV